MSRSDRSEQDWEKRTAADGLVTAVEESDKLRAEIRRLRAECALQRLWIIELEAGRES